MNRALNLSLLLCVALVSACSNLQKTDDISVQKSTDPLQSFNRKMYAFNTAADNAIAKPVAKAYKRALPKPARSGINNFFDNLGEPLNVLNNLLQGKFDSALHSTYRFTVNSTIGLLGFFDVANKFGVEEKPEDFGQTLAAWGVKPGPYLMLPILGPSNMRDAFGRLGSSAVYYPNDLITESAGTALGLTILEGVEVRSGFLGSDELLDMQLDPYLFLKSAYETDRIRRLYDGDPPAAQTEEYDF